jgi:hypothetical protein
MAASHNRRAGKNTPTAISGPQEVLVRAEALRLELGIPITPGSGVQSLPRNRDIYELAYIRKDGSGLPAAVSVAVHAVCGNTRTRCVDALILVG